MLFARFLVLPEANVTSAINVQIDRVAEPGWRQNRRRSQIAVVASVIGAADRSSRYRCGTPRGARHRGYTPLREHCAGTSVGTSVGTRGQQERGLCHISVARPVRQPRRFGIS